MNQLSVVIPTYSGEQFLPATLDSLLHQNGNHQFELIIVIDGPNKALKKIAEEYKKKFTLKKIMVTIKQFSRNRGRFSARYEGAKLANSKNLLFVDDRDIMDSNYINEIYVSGAKVLIPNVIQNNDTTPISKTLYLIRRYVYRGQFENFQSYFIDKNNFEKSAKGTAGLFVPKDLFIRMCKKNITYEKNLKEVSDDTKLLKGIINSGEKIFKSCEAKIYYQSRTKFGDEIKHLFERGPKFVDYYLKPKTRFFGPLITCLIAFPIVIILCIIYPVLLAVIAGLFILTIVALSILLARNFSDALNICLGLPLIIFTFAAGILKGIAWKYL